MEITTVKYRDYFELDESFEIERVENTNHYEPVNTLESQKGIGENNIINNEYYVCCGCWVRCF